MKNAINDHLIGLYEKHGTLTPEMVVEDAKQPESPLHGLFEWDTEKAAYQHWIETARQLIRSIRVSVVREERVVRVPYFVRDPELSPDKQGYTSVVKLRSHVDLAREAVAEECARAVAAFRRASEVAAAVGVDADITELLMRTVHLLDTVRKQANKA